MSRNSVAYLSAFTAATPSTAASSGTQSAATERQCAEVFHCWIHECSLACSLCCLHNTVQLSMELYISAEYVNTVHITYSHCSDYYTVQSQKSSTSDCQQVYSSDVMLQITQAVAGDQQWFSTYSTHEPTNTTVVIQYTHVNIHIHCVQKNTHSFFHILMNDVWI